MSIVGYTRLARCVLSEGGLYILIESSSKAYLT